MNGMNTTVLLVAQPLLFRQEPTHGAILRLATNRFLTNLEFSIAVGLKVLRTGQIKTLGR